MPDDRKRVTLTKAQCETGIGRELLDLLTELSDDGNVSRDEMERLRAWLEVDRSVEFAALPFLYELVDQVSSDGEVNENELDRLAIAIERVLPKDVRAVAAQKRKESRDARRIAQRERLREEGIAERQAKRVSRGAALARDGLLYRKEFAVRGAFRFAERRAACERLLEGDTVTLEREPDNPPDPNAVLVLGAGDCELGYAPREEAETLAKLLDDGGATDVVVERLWETPDGQIVPIVLVKVRAGRTPVPGAELAGHRGSKESKPDGPRNAQESKSAGGSGCSLAVVLMLIVLGLMVSVIM